MCLRAGSAGSVPAAAASKPARLLHHTKPSPTNQSTPSPAAFQHPTHHAHDINSHSILYLTSPFSAASLSKISRNYYPSSYILFSLFFTENICPPWLASSSSAVTSRCSSQLLFYPAMPSSHQDSPLPSMIQAKKKLTKPPAIMGGCNSGTVPLSPSSRSSRI